MARGGRSPPAKPAAAPAKPAESPAAASPAPAAAPKTEVHHHHHSAPAPAAPAHSPAPAHHAPPPAPVQDSGPGIGGMIMQGAAMGAGSAAGSMAINALFGGGSSSSSSGGGSQPVAVQNQCQEFDRLFHKCLADNNNDMSACNFVFKDLESCKKQYGMI